MRTTAATLGAAFLALAHLAHKRRERGILLGVLLQIAQLCLLNPWLLFGGRKCFRTVVNHLDDGAMGRGSDWQIGKRDLQQFYRLMNLRHGVRR